MARNTIATIILRGTKKSIERTIKKLVLDVTANLVGTTPVDTGWARSNWVPSIGTPVEQPTGSKESVSSGAQDQGLAAVAATYTLERGPIWISNNVPYITLLNSGTSQQAPAGFVQAAIRRAVDDL